MCMLARVRVCAHMGGGVFHVTAACNVPLTGPPILKCRSMAGTLGTAGMGFTIQMG